MCWIMTPPEVGSRSVSVALKATSGLFRISVMGWRGRKQLPLLDFDPDVAGIASQPFWLHWHDGREKRCHARAGAAGFQSVITTAKGVGPWRWGFCVPLVG